MNGAELCKRGTGRCEIVARFEEFLAARMYEPIRLAEICAALDVSERKLRACCKDQLGTSPIQYFLNRRMYLARQSLQIADQSKRTVTQIAAEYGFLELGRFSVRYRSLFGESPSVTLRTNDGLRFTTGRLPREATTSD